MKLVTCNEKISLDELKAMSEKMFHRIVKAVVDIDKAIMVVDAQMHADQEALLLEQDSEQKHLWGINLNPHASGSDFIEFDSIINFRPDGSNRSRGVDDPAMQHKIQNIVNNLVIK